MVNSNVEIGRNVRPGIAVRLATIEEDGPMLLGIVTNGMVTEKNRQDKNFIRGNIFFSMTAVNTNTSAISKLMYPVAIKGI